MIQKSSGKRFWEKKLPDNIPWARPVILSSKLILLPLGISDRFASIASVRTGEIVDSIDIKTNDGSPSSICPSGAAIAFTFSDGITAICFQEPKLISSIMQPTDSAEEPEIV
jgi:hypothetical protein